MNVQELFTKQNLLDHIDAGYVVMRKHDSLDLWILNYTAKAQYLHAWNAVTINCRGLIVDARGEIVARPFPKFFNYGELDEEGIDLDASAHVTDKLDGSLGIAYPTPDGPAIATRGSFHSEQAEWATRHLHENYPDWRPAAGYTDLFEIIYPENRIVVDYEGEESLCLLGSIDIETGEILTARSTAFEGLWPGPTVRWFASCETLRDALEITPRPNAEGVVVHLIDDDQLIKIKQEDYVRLHRVVTGLSELSIWEHLRSGKTVAELLEDLPDEFHDWAAEIAHSLEEERDCLKSLIVYAFESREGYCDDRKGFARSVADHPYKAELFMLLDGKDITDRVWQHVRPIRKEGKSDG